MNKASQKLISISSNALAPAEFPRLERFHETAGEKFATDLSVLLSLKNGFFAFESALHVFPSRSGPSGPGLLEWNDTSLWARDYQGMADGYIFFAEDIFGAQFCARQDGIYSFDPETGAVDHLADDIDGWARAILDDYEVLTGHTLSHGWQAQYGALPPNTRLVPKIPFVTGGEYVIENLYVLDSTKAMQLRANLAVQIRDLPDGAPIKWQVTE